jgi:hypothetical protein
LTVTFWPPEVDSVKPDADTLLTVPIEPPAAGPDRALDPLAPAPEAAGKAWALPLLLLLLLAVVVVLLEVAATIP